MVKITVNFNYKKTVLQYSYLQTRPTHSGCFSRSSPSPTFARLMGLSGSYCFPAHLITIYFLMCTPFQEISGQSWPWSYDMTLHIEIGVILLKYFVMIFSYVPSDIIYNSLTLCIPSEGIWLEFNLSHLVSNEHSLPLENMLFSILTR